MMKVDRLEDTIRKLMKSDYASLYLGMGSGTELFADYDQNPTGTYVGVELDNDSFIIALRQYYSLSRKAQDRISLLKQDATRLSEKLENRFDQIIINYPWDNVNTYDDFTGLYTFLTEDRDAGDYLRNLLKPDGKVLIRVHPDQRDRLDNLIANLVQAFADYNLRELPDHPESGFGLKYLVNQRSPTYELKLGN